MIVEVLSDEPQRARLGERGRLRALERFTWRSHAIGLVEMWRAELADHAARTEGARAHR